MLPPTREFIRVWWSTAWSEGLWAAAWSKAVGGLTAEQAAWSPPSAPSAPARHHHSIWQLTLHMVFWRESWLRRVATGVKPSAEELAIGNFPGVAEPSEQGWAEARRRLAESHERMGQLLADPSLSDEHFRILAHFIPHDNYHVGQIMLIRGLLGLPPIE